MELRHIHSFMAVAEEKSFTRAALRLHIAQPPLSLRIRELEEELGVRLFIRSTRRVSLTTAGQAFLAQVQPALRQLDQAVVACRRAQQGEIGQLRLGYTGRASQAQLPALSHRFRQAYPEITLDILGPYPTGRLRHLLLNDELDAALCFLPLEDTQIDTVLLTESEFALALPASHPLAARRATVALADLASEPFVAYPAGAGFHLRHAMEAICLDAGFVPKVVREADASQTLLCLIAAGVGIGVIPRETKALAMEGVVYKPLPRGTRRIRHGVAWMRNNHNPALGHFLAQLTPSAARAASTQAPS